MCDVVTTEVPANLTGSSGIEAILQSCHEARGPRLFALQTASLRHMLWTCGPSAAHTPGGDRKECSGHEERIWVAHHSIHHTNIYKNQWYRGNGGGGLLLQNKSFKRFYLE